MHPSTGHTDCENAFINLKNHLSTALILSFPQFDSDADDFSLYTDASGMGVGAVMEQSGKVFAYASRSLTQAERQYSTIQKECLAIMLLNSFVITSWADTLTCTQTMHHSNG